MSLKDLQLTCTNNLNAYFILSAAREQHFFLSMKSQSRITIDAVGTAKAACGAMCMVD